MEYTVYPLKPKSFTSMKFTTTLILMSFSVFGFSQILKTTNLNLNAGGVIHDVAYDSYYDAFVVVGEFVSINGQTRNNLAFIDANTYALMPQSPISSINGSIRSVELYTYTFLHPTLGNTTRSYLYLGGDFTTVNGNTRNYIARFLASHVYNQQPAGTLVNYIFNPWDAELPSYTSTARDGVHDLLLSGDTLVAAGYFSMYSGGTSYTTTQWKNLLPIDADATTMTLKPILQNYANQTTNCIHGIRKLGSHFYIYGEETANDEFIYQLTTNGTLIQDLESCGSESVVYDIEPHVTDIDTLLFSLEKYSGSGPAFASYQIDGTPIFCPFTPTGNSIIDLATINSSQNFLEVYKNYLFVTDATGFYSSKRNGQTNVPISGNFQTNANWLSAYPNVNTAPCFKRVKDRLFVSSKNLTSVNGTPRNRLAILCLEPNDAKPFTSFDNTACEGDSSIYTTPQVEYADGYRWSYSGTGAQYRIAGSGNPWASLVSVNLSANSIEVYFPNGATGGTLTVEPYSVCNTATDYQYSQGQSDVITINPKPDIILAPTHSLNCYSDTALIVVQSTMPNVTYNWAYNNGGATSTNDTILITPQNGNGFNNSNYVVTVTNPTTGCFNRDTTLFNFDTLAVQIDANLATTTPTEWNCLTDSMTLDYSQPNYIVQWENPATGLYYSNPLTIYSTPTGAVYNLHGIQISNGCPTQDAFGAFNVNEASADPVFIGHPNFVTDLIDDSLSCAIPSLSIQCDVDPAYSGIATAQWAYEGTSLGTDLLNLTTADSAGMDGNGLKYYTIVTTHSTSFCTDSTQIIIRFDYDKPNVGSMADQTINCSQSEVLLTHPQNGLPYVTEGWLDGSGAQTNSDTLTTAIIGEYYYQVQSTLNGCTNVDTVLVYQTLDLWLDMPQDTLICPQQIVTISPIVIGNTETPSFVWSTGATTPTQTATGGVDNQLIVTVSTPSGCTGTDSTTILITQPVDVTVTPYIACTQGSLEITDVSGGAGNYQFSLDGTTWQDSLNFSGLSFGAYTVFVQDDLGCVYDTTAQLDGTASSVAMNFVVSTYNEEGDTIVLVNVTEFTGLDTVAWMLPSNANVTFENASKVVLSIGSGGWYDIELIGYIGSDCEYSFTKPVYFGDYAPVFDDSTNINGIVDYSIYPNPLNLSTNSTITVDVEFGKAQNYTILVINSLGQPIPSMSVSGVGEIVSHQFSFPLGTAAGMYRLHIISDYGAQQVPITLF